MHYTVRVNGKMKQILSCAPGLFLALIVASCGGGITPPVMPEAAIAAPTSPVPSTDRVSSESLPQICNCVMRFDHISIEQGLSQSSVRVIFQDSRGFLWFGTEDGLNRYDGYTFKTYKPDPDAPQSLSDRWISSIVEDKAGILWIATRLGGLNYYDPRTEQFKHFLH